ncbi:sporulation protein [Paludifilum halophilum]|uniref:Sporulation protein n=1 Tax=Paludifilum halophilum TaxID=1642702 RepID=A0A235B7D1_9BACL|nr:sporulation protein [Paludifilum halophilum]OYD07505.1 hypothetical protein CHM34_11460 [Paludifilum halophilum]
MLKNLMAKLGKGGAKVDLVLDREDYTPGEPVSGELTIQGGTVEQKINRIDVELLMSIRVKERDFSHVIARFPFHESFTVHPEEKKSFPFSCELPQDLPLSGNQVVYYFITHLDIAAGVDHSDHDYIRVHPPHRLQKVLTAFEELGLREKYDSRSFNGYVQEFELFPTSFLQDRVEEVEFVAAYEDTGLRLMLEVDLFSFFGEKEIRREVHLENELLDESDRLVEHLQSLLLEMVENPDAYAYPRFSGTSGEHKHGGFSKIGGAVGGFAAGVLGGVVLSELMDELTEDEAEAAEEEESSEEETPEEESEEEGGFFEDLFGGESEEGDDEGGFFGDLFEGDDE